MNSWSGVNIGFVQHAVSADGTKILVNCAGLTTGSFSYDPGAATLGSFSATIKQSNSLQGRFTALAGVTALNSTTFSTGTFSCNGYGWLLFDITAAGSGLISVDFTGNK